MPSPPHWLSSAAHRPPLVPHVLGKTFIYLTLRPLPTSLFSFKTAFLERIYCRWCCILHLPSRLGSARHWASSCPSADPPSPGPRGPRGPRGPPVASSLAAAFDPVGRALPETFYSLGFLHTTSDCFRLDSGQLLSFPGWPLSV